MLSNRLRLRFQTRGPSQRTAIVDFQKTTHMADSWQYDHTITGPADEHPVTQFRRLGPELLARIERALVAVHGEPEQQTERIDLTEWSPIPESEGRPTDRYVVADGTSWTIAEEIADTRLVDPDAVLMRRVTKVTNA